MPSSIAMPGRRWARLPGPVGGQSRWLADVLARLTVASGVGYLAASYSASRWLTRRSRCRPRWHAYGGLPACEPLECRTVDGNILRGWAISPPRPRGTVALFHGLRRSREQASERVAVLARAGYRCVAFDHRAHGESTGRYTTFGYREAGDVRAVIRLMRDRWPFEPTAAIGISMGAAALCFAAEAARGLRAVILESLYHDIGSAFASRIGGLYPEWFRRFSAGVAWVTERRLGLRMAALAPGEQIGQLAPAPVLLISGTDDGYAPVAQTRRLARRCRGPHELWLVKGARHLDVFQKAGPEYSERVVGFLERHLQGAPLGSASASTFA